MVRRKVNFEFDPFRLVGESKRGLSESKKRRILKEVKEFVFESVLDKVGDGNSPVEGGGSFKRLSQDYAAEQKGGDRTPNLELEGDMLDAFRVRRKGEKLSAFVLKPQEEKADGHNQHTTKAKSWALQKGFPRRRFIPDKGQRWSSDILREIRKIIQENK